MDSGIRMLIVEDDPQLGRALVRALADAGHQVSWVRTLEDGELHAQTQTYDAVVLDLGLPDGSGLSLLRQMRRRGNKTPVLILTAKDAVEDRVRGLDDGADDYMPKPFAVPELLSRLRALVRRSAGFADRIWQIGKLSLDPEAHAVRVEGRLVELSPMEYRILHHLARQSGKVVARVQLEEGLFELGEEPESNSLEVHVHHLRKKLGIPCIRTIRGVGYLLETE